MINNYNIDSFQSISFCLSGENLQKRQGDEGREPEQHLRHRRENVLRNFRRTQDQRRTRQAVGRELRHQ